MLGRVISVAALAAGSVLLSKQLKKKQSARDASAIEESIEVNIPADTAYNQWTQFEAFPQFMASVHEVKQLDDRHLHWRANVFGNEKEWDVEITEQIPDKRIAWRSINGPFNAGVVTFHKISDNCTRITLQMEYKPEGTMENIGDMLGAMRLEVRQNLQRFKELLEQRGKETGAWRGAVPQH
jgi:uncharacterized membrane protein